MLLLLCYRQPRFVAADRAVLPLAAPRFRQLRRASRTTEPCSTEKIIRKRLSYPRIIRPPAHPSCRSALPCSRVVMGIQPKLLARELTKSYDYDIYNQN